MRTFLFSVVLAACAAVAAPAFADDAAMRDLSVQQNVAAQSGRQSPGSLRVTAWFDRASLTYAIGDRVRIFVQTNEDAYVTVLNVGPSGQVTQLFPNAFQPDNQVRAGKPVEIGSGAARIVAEGPSGPELVKVIASSAPLRIIPNDQLATRGAFALVEGGVDGLARNLEAVAAPTAPVAKVAITNRAIRTVQTAGAAANGTAIVVVPGSITIHAGGQPIVRPAPVAVGQVGSPDGTIPSFTIPISGAGNPFPLFIATDKSIYAASNPVAVAVTSLQQCYLTVFELDPSGRARIVFPNRLVQNNLVNAMQTTLVAGAASPVTLGDHGLAGTDQLIAVCSKDPAPVSSVQFDFSQLFTPAGASETLWRDLATAAGRIAGSTSLAASTFTVQP